MTAEPAEAAWSGPAIVVVKAGREFSIRRVSRELDASAVVVVEEKNGRMAFVTREPPESIRGALAILPQSPRGGRQPHRPDVHTGTLSAPEVDRVLNLPEGTVTRWAREAARGVAARAR